MISETPLGFTGYIGTPLAAAERIAKLPVFPGEDDAPTTQMDFGEKIARMDLFCIPTFLY
jgi:hypothetical protein